jgi:hypothetical protein
MAPQTALILFAGWLVGAAFVCRSRSVANRANFRTQPAAAGMLRNCIIGCSSFEGAANRNSWERGGPLTCAEPHPELRPSRC